MGNVSELEKYLRTKGKEGRKDSEGVFSISREAALKKIAGFQLPFEGAWALKLVQAAVATGSCSKIKVRLSRYEQSFEFVGVQGWTGAQVETALYDTDRCDDRSVNHLVAALRGVGFSDLRGFWLGLPGQDSALTWDGEELERTPLEKPLTHTLLSVTCKARFEDGGFFGLSSFFTARERNATVGHVLVNLAYTSPVPLDLDGRRLDALEFNPTHGWGKVSQLLAMGFEDGGALPSLKIPERTGRAGLPDHPVEDTMKTATVEMRTRESNRTHCSVAYLISAHLERVKSGKTHVWKERESCSHCNWVADGVVVQAESADTQASFCSVGWYLSADGLETDLTSLYLRQSESKEQRFRESVKLVSKGLQEVMGCDLSKISEIESKNAKTGGAIFLLLGAGVTFLSPFHGVVCLGIGALSYWSSGNVGKERERSLYNGVENLVRNFDTLTQRLNR